MCSMADIDRIPTSNVEESQVQSDFSKAFYRRRFPNLPWALLLVLYAPIGLFLTLLRVCMSLQAMLILFLFPEGAVKRFVLRVYFSMLGIVVIKDSFHRKGSQTKVFLSNRLSPLDHIALHLALDCVTVSTKGKAPPLHFLFPHRKFLATREEALEVEAKELPQFDESKSHISFPPLVIQPEPMPTNGSHMLLKFSSWPCSLDSIVQPIALSAVRPLGIKLTLVDSSQWWDLFWTAFVPVTIFRVKLLPPMERREEEDESELSRRVQSALGEELDVMGSEVTIEAVNKWMSEINPPTPSSSPSPTPDPPPSSEEPSLDIENMVRQVTAVMPQVPHTAIRKDLLRTHSVDATITNLLEGLVPYDPLPPPQPVAKPPPAVPKSPPISSVELKPRRFSSPAMEAMQRQLSFQERKKSLLENARRRYIEKHGLDVNA